MVPEAKGNSPLQKTATPVVPRAVCQVLKPSTLCFRVAGCIFSQEKKKKKNNLAKEAEGICHENSNTSIAAFNIPNP